MAKLVLNMSVSLDGYVARRDGDVDWMLDDQDYGYSAFYRGVDAVLMGRRTYRQALSFGGVPYKDKRRYVFSRSLRETRDGSILVGENALALVYALKAGAPGTLWLVGGAELAASLLEAVDEIKLSIHPVLLGEGIPLFPAGIPPADLKLIGSQAFSSGLVQVSYGRP